MAFGPGREAQAWNLSTELHGKVRTGGGRPSCIRGATRAMSGAIRTMSRDTFQMDASIADDEEYQNRILPHVSRTFALTIPQLPPALRTPVTNAYLLCRIADTIEDEVEPSVASTLVLQERFVAVVCGREAADALARDVLPLLSARTLPAERRFCPPA